VNVKLSKTIQIINVLSLHQCFSNCVPRQTSVPPEIFRCAAKFLRIYQRAKVFEKLGENFISVTSQKSLRNTALHKPSPIINLSSFLHYDIPSKCSIYPSYLNSFTRIIIDYIREVALKSKRRIIDIYIDERSKKKKIN
jgi:hypothetical protein